MICENKFLGKRFIADMHNHTNASLDSSFPIDDLCLTHIKKGTSAIAITDHSDYELYKTRNPYDTVTASFKAATIAKEKYDGRLEILRGVEISCALWDRKTERDMIDSFDFDVVLGSLHTALTPLIDIAYSSFDFSTTPIDDIHAFLEVYYSNLYETAQKADFDVLSHINCPLRYINGKYGRGVCGMKYEEQMREIMKVIIKRGKALEVNTSNYNYGFNFFMPDREILLIYRELGGKLLTIGSDAHMESGVAVATDQAIEMILSAGFDELCLYRKREPFSYSIAD